MKTLFKTIAAFGLMALALSCSKNDFVEKDVEEEIDYSGPTTEILATVVLPSETKLLYSEVDGTGMASGLKSKWTEDDTIEVISDKGERVTLTMVSGAGESTAEFRGEAHSVSDATVWKALIGSHSSDVNQAIRCTYLGQDGTIDNIGDYDFVTTTATGLTPTFDFKDSGERLSYFMRLKLPAGIKSIEYNADAYWDVTKNSNEAGFYDDFNQVTEIVLPSATSAGAVVYIAVPATVHQAESAKSSPDPQAGIIFTFFNDGKTKSYGQVFSTSLEERGGKIGTIDITSMTLIDRVLPSDALDFGSVTVTMAKDTDVNSYNNLGEYTFQTVVSAKWSPYNLGSDFSSPADRGSYVGGCYSWGSITAQTGSSSDTWKSDNYKYSGLINDQLGKRHSYQISGPDGIGSLVMQQISGTKYDAARVHWGIDWRMPTIQELYMFTGGSTSVDYGPADASNKTAEMTTASGFTTKGDVISVAGKDMNVRWFSKNGNKIYFPLAGYNKKADWANSTNFYSRGFYWGDGRIRATPSNNALTNAPLTMEIQRGGDLYYGKVDGGVDKQPFCGFYIRPVVNNLNRSDAGSSTPSLIEDGNDVPVVYPSSTLYGYVKNSTNDEGISGVVVSDGYSCCVTDKFGMYQMKANENARTVSVTVPSAYEIPAAFYQVLGSKVDGKWADKDFTLTPRAAGAGSRATIVAVADPHVKDATTQTRFNAALTDVASTITTLKTSGLPVGTPANAAAGDVVCVALGDQMWDVMAKASDIKTAFNTIGAPVLYVMGNHDNDNSESSDRACENVFIDNFAPTNYSIDIANVHIMVMDDIIYTGNGSSTINHKEGFSKEQVDWLKADIAKVQNAGDKIGVLCVHAPLAGASAGDSGAQEAVMSALKNNFYNVHVLSGHNHNVNNNRYHGWAARSGKSICEHTLQTISGYWWEYDVAYVTGSPAGYGVFTFDNTCKDLYAEYNKVTKQNASFQMRVYNGGSTYNKNSAYDEMMHGGSRGYKEYTWDSPAKDKLVVRLNDPNSSNDEDDYWTVSATINGSASAMTRVSTEIKDACVASYVFNKIKGTHGDANGTTDHIWYSTANYNSSFTVTATHTMPYGWSATYTSTHIVGTDYKGFAYGALYD